MNIPRGGPPAVPAPTETLVIGPDAEILLVLDGMVVLPVGARIELPQEGVDATVIGIRLVRGEIGALQLHLEVDISGTGPSFEAAVLQADAEAQVVEAAEEITSGELISEPSSQESPGV